VKGESLVWDKGRLRRTLSRPLAQRRRWVEVTDASTQSPSWLSARRSTDGAFDFARTLGSVLAACWSVRTQSSHVGESRSLSMDASGTDAKFTVLLRNRMLSIGGQSSPPTESAIDELTKSSLLTDGSSSAVGSTISLRTLLIRSHYRFDCASRKMRDQIATKQRQKHSERVDFPTEDSTLTVHRMNQAIKRHGFGGPEPDLN